MESAKTISAIIPTYNRENTILRCIDSVLRQTYPVSEIIVVDDGSSDRTLQLVEEAYGNKIKIIKQLHKGAQAARNAGIMVAQGEYIAFLDSDDEWTEKKIALQMHVLEEKPNAVVCGNGYIMKDGYKTIFRMKGYSGEVYKCALVSSFALFPAIMTKKENLIKVGLLDEKVPSFQEWDTAIMLSRECEFVFLDKPLFIYHMHDGDTISKNHDRDILGQEYILNKYKQELLLQYGINGLKKRYKIIYERCRDFKNIRYFKYRLLYFLSSKGILYLGSYNKVKEGRRD
jgi:glycosyltransferase involved in cell wall biosynthesis